MKFTKKDLFFSITTGSYAGLIVWKVFKFLSIDIFDKLGIGLILGKPDLYISSAWMILIIPILWILGVNLGYFLGRWINFFNQFGRFAVIGFTNFAVYTGILNLFLWQTGVNKGFKYSLFVSIAFIVSVVHSYGWNKYWVFESGDSGKGAGEFTKFLGITSIAGLINVIIASLIVNFVHPLFGISADGWANIGGIIGSAFALSFSFVGIRLVVFKKNDSNAISQIQTPNLR